MQAKPQQQQLKRAHSHTHHSPHTLSTLSHHHTTHTHTHSLSLYTHTYRSHTYINNEVTRQLINENSVCVNLVKRMCKDLNINNPGEWGLYEVWDHPDLPEMPGMRERKIPNNEVLLDQTILKWEVATRLRWGMVAAMPETSFKLVLEEHEPDP